MAADIVNLRQVRKQKARAEKERQASENRAKHGQTKATRRHESANKALDNKRLDGLVRDLPNAKDAPLGPGASEVNANDTAGRDRGD